MNPCRQILILRNAEDHERFHAWQCVSSYESPPRDSCHDFTGRGWVDIRDAWPREGIPIQFDVVATMRGGTETFAGFRKGNLFFNRLSALTEFFQIQHVTKWSYFLPR